MSTCSEKDVSKELASKKANIMLVSISVSVSLRYVDVYTEKDCPKEKNR